MGKVFQYQAMPPLNGGRGKSNRSSLFFSFSVFEVLSSPKEFQWCFKKVLSVFEVSGCFKEASRMFQ